LTVDFVELFCGIGGFRLGLEKANQKCVNSKQRLGNQKGQSGELSSSRGIEKRSSSVGFKCVWANDWEYADYKWKKNKKTGKLEWKGTKNKAGEIYTKHWDDGTYIDADIKTIDVDTIPDHTLLTAGFPCQAFSVAGKRKGFQDTRGTLFHEICRVAEAKRPPLLLLENVKGLLSHDEGLTFQIIIESLEELGYLCEWQVLNSKYFGVPQNRERVFIVGHLRGTGSRQVFPIAKGNGISGQTTESKQRSRKRVRSQISSTIDSRYGALRNAGETYLVHNVYGGFGEGMRVFGDYSPTIRTPKGGGHLPMVVADRTRTYADKGRNLESPKDMTNALSSVQKDNLLLKNCKIRRLTPTECERLQGFPDGWTEFGIEQRKCFKLVRLFGNIWQDVSVPLRVAKERLLIESQRYALCITKDGENGVLQTSPIHQNHSQKPNVDTVKGLVKVEQEVCVCGTTNLGSGMVMLYSQKGTSHIEKLTKKNLILGKMAEKCTYPLLRVQLEENCGKEKLSTMLIWISEIIASKIFISAKTEQPITNAIIHLKKLPPNSLRKASLVLRMAYTSEVKVRTSNTQRYKLLGNAVTVNVIEYLGKRLLEVLQQPISGE